LPRGRFHLTPLYDVISAQPSIDSAQVRRNQIKLAMAVGKNRHWQIYEIMPRHFIQTAAMSGMGAKLVEDIFEELIASAELALDKVTSQLPNHFPQELVASIGNGVKERLKRIRPKGIG
jgi:serine/threonine-protein kinase HipA